MKEEIHSDLPFEKFPYETGRKTKEHRGGEEENTELAIGDKFWSRLTQMIGAYDFGNPKTMTIIFNSKNTRLKDSAHKMKLQMEKTEKTNAVVVTGKYLINRSDQSGQIIFNIGRNDIPPEDLARVITHEIIHYAQDCADKYPDMNDPKKYQNGQSEPWKQEAYRLQERLYNDSIKYCEFLN